MKNILKTAILSITILSATACTTTGIQSNTIQPIQSNQLNKLSTVKYGTIIEVQDVFIQKNPNTGSNVVVSVGGAILGGLVGNQFGGGSGQDIATAFGALLGGYGANELYNRYGQSGAIVKRVVFSDTNGNQYAVLQEDPHNRLIAGKKIQFTGNSYGETRITNVY